MIRFIAPSLLCLAAASVHGADEPLFPEEDAVMQEFLKAREDFRLFNDCRPMPLEVWVSENNFELTRERILTLVESRLRAARLYRAPVTLEGLDDKSLERMIEYRQSNQLVIGVDTFESGRAYSISMIFRKWLSDSASSENGFGDTWQVGSYGINGTASGILQTVSEMIDEFINEYLRVNGVACD